MASKMETRYIDDKMQKVWATILGIEASIIIFSNLTAMRIFMKRKFRICKSSYLLINLTMADILVGFATLCVLIEVLYARESLNTISCVHPINTLSFTFSIFTLIGSVTNLALMAFERAVAVVAPFRLRHITTKHYVFAMAVCWCLSMLILLRNYFCYPDDFIARRVLAPINMFVIITSILTIILSYTAILVKVKCRPSIQVNRTMKNNIRLTKTTLITTLVALCTWLPRLFAYIVKKQLSIIFSDNVNILLSSVIFSNSFANLFVYALRMPAFRKELKNMVMSTCRFPANKVRNHAVMQLEGREGGEAKAVYSEKSSRDTLAQGSSSSQIVSCSKVIVSIENS